MWQFSSLAAHLLHVLLELDPSGGLLPLPGRPALALALRPLDLGQLTEQRVGIVQTVPCLAYDGPAGALTDSRKQLQTVRDRYSHLRSFTDTYSQVQTVTD